MHKVQILHIILYFVNHLIVYIYTQNSTESSTTKVEYNKLSQFN